MKEKARYCRSHVARYTLRRHIENASKKSTRAPKTDTRHIWTKIQNQNERDREHEASTKEEKQKGRTHNIRDPMNEIVQTRTSKIIRLNHHEIVCATTQTNDVRDSNQKKAIRPASKRKDDQSNQQSTRSWLAHAICCARHMHTHASIHAQNHAQAGTNRPVTAMV